MLPSGFGGFGPRLSGLVGVDDPGVLPAVEPGPDFGSRLWPGVEDGRLVLDGTFEFETPLDAALVVEEALEPVADDAWLLVPLVAFELAALKPRPLAAEFTEPERG